MTGDDIMKILHTSDWHLGKNLEGYSRLEEQGQFLEELLEIVDREKIDLVIISEIYTIVGILLQRLKNFLFLS